MKRRVWGLWAAGCALMLMSQRGAAATAQPATAPVSINLCAPQLQPNPTPSNQPTFMGIPIGTVTSTSTGMHIVFVNNGKSTIKLVNFAVDSNGNQFVIRDVGTFSPGVEIDHNYRNGAGQGFILPAFLAPNVKCAVASVVFSDGTMWRRGEPQNVVSHTIASPGQSVLTVSPANVMLEARSESTLFMVQAATRLSNLKETDNCTGIASVFEGAVADNAASYYVRPLGPGTCAAHVIDENGNTASIPITIR